MEIANVVNMQIMSEVFILGGIYAFQVYKDLMRDKGLKDSYNQKST